MADLVMQTWETANIQCCYVSTAKGVNWERETGALKREPRRTRSDSEYNNSEYNMIIQYIVNPMDQATFSKIGEHGSRRGLRTQKAGDSEFGILKLTRSLSEIAKK